MEGGLSFAAKARRWNPLSVPSRLRSFSGIFFPVEGNLAIRNILDTMKK
jgi:hypothetical protein